MMKKVLFGAMCALMACFAVSCGGNQNKSATSDSTAAGSGLFADVMTLVNEYQAKDAELSEKMQAAGQAQDSEKIERLMEEQKALKPEFEEKLMALSQKLSGTVVEYELPDSFFYQVATAPAVKEVTPNGLNATGYIEFTINAKKDLKVGKYKGDDFRVFMKLVDKAGNTLGYHIERAIADDTKPQEIKAGAALKPATLGVVLAEKNNKEANVAKIVFVTQAEWEQSLSR